MFPGEDLRTQEIYDGKFCTISTCLLISREDIRCSFRARSTFDGHLLVAT